MDDRLERCGRSLATFLEDELSSTNLGLSLGCRAHLDRFRAVLQAYYVEKFGYYPPSGRPESTSSIFPKCIYESMRVEFQNLYDLLVDEKLTYGNCGPAQGGLCVLQNVQAFDQRNFYEPLPHPLPLLPEVAQEASRPASRRLSWAGSLLRKHDKLEPDGRLVNLSSLAKASNGRKTELLRCPLVRAYREFEKECIFPNVTADKNAKLSLADARKVRWIMIYAMLQTLNSATEIPDEVRDSDVSYNLCIPTAGCPPWQDEQISDLLLPITGQAERDLEISSGLDTNSTASTPYTESLNTPTGIEPDIDYFSLRQQSLRTNSLSDSTKSPAVPQKSSIRRALTTLGKMPEILHPKPIRNSFHEVLVRDSGNSSNITPKSPRPFSAMGFGEHSRRISAESDNSGTTSDDLHSPTWSHSNGGSSPPSSIGDSEHRNSNSSSIKPNILEDLLEKPCPVLVRRSSSIYSQDDGAGIPDFRPEPLDLCGVERQRVSMRLKKKSVQYEMINGMSLMASFCF
jgi:hypothetical protein